MAFKEVCRVVVALLVMVMVVVSRSRGLVYALVWRWEGWW
jgi:hypothetical protein